MYCARWSNEAATVHADIWPDQPDVPAERETYVEHKLSTSLFPSVKGYCSGDELDFSARTSSPCRPLDR